MGQMILELAHFGEGNSKPDNTEITSALLYYSTEEMREFKSLCKTGIKDLYGADATTKGNVSDFILKLLRKQYGQQFTSAIQPDSEDLPLTESANRPTDGAVEDDIPPI